MAGNPERMRPTADSDRLIVKQANEIVMKTAVDVLAVERGKRRGSKKLIWAAKNFISGKK